MLRGRNRKATRSHRVCLVPDIFSPLILLERHLYHIVAEPNVYGDACYTRGGEKYLTYDSMIMGRGSNHMLSLDSLVKGLHYQSWGGTASCVSSLTPSKKSHKR